VGEGSSAVDAVEERRTGGRKGMLPAITVGLLKLVEKCPDVTEKLPDIVGKQPDVIEKQPDLVGKRPNLVGEQPDVVGAHLNYDKSRSQMAGAMPGMGRG
jgi:hypothetical protein